MNKIIIDVETSGLPNLCSDLSTYKNIVQLSFSVLDSQNFEISTGNFIIKQKVAIPEEASRMHGITDAIAEERGIDFFKVMDILIPNMKLCEIIIGHNVAFDLNSMQAEYVKEGKEKPEVKLKVIDTMLEALKTGIFTHENGEKRWPKLTELYKYLFGEDFSDAHNSFADVRATKRCYIEMIKRKMIKIT